MPTAPNRAKNAASGQRRPSRPRPRWGRIGLVLVLTLGLLGFLGLSCGLYFAKSLEKRLDRTDAFGALTGGRPVKTVSGALNILILGSDKREQGQDVGVEGERTDSMMILHINADHNKAYIISIPRDAWVYIPKSGDYGGERAKVNAAHAWGGIPLAIRTVERLTSVKLDHVIKVDFAGFEKMTDALGGVDVHIDETTYDPRSKRTFQQGWNHLDGAAALDYVRQRYNLPAGDFDRMHRQQVFLRALMKKATDTDTLTSPTKLKSFLEAAADSLTVDKDFSLTDTALQFRKLRMDNLTFITVPNSGSATRNGESVILLDEDSSSSLFDAIRTDTLATWVKDNPVNDPTAGR